MSHALTSRLPDLRPRKRTLLWAALLVNVEVLLAAVYTVWLTSRGGTIAVATLALPFVWINVAIWAVAATDTPRVGRRRRLVALAVGAGYFLLLAAVGGLVGPGHSLHGHSHARGLSVLVALPPGWGPMVVYSGSLVGAQLVPFKLAGYAALAYLVYDTVLETDGAVGALVGVFSCVSCTWPVLGTVLATVFGGGSAVVAAASGQPYLASTAVFVSAVALLSWRPTL